MYEKPRTIAPFQRRVTCEAKISAFLPPSQVCRVDEYLAFSNIGAYSYPRTSKDTRFQMLEIVLP